MPTLAGKATYPDGTPAAGATVKARVVVSTVRDRPAYAGVRGIYGVSPVRVAADGSWTIEGLPANDDPDLLPAGTVYEVTVSVPGRLTFVEYAALRAAGPAVQQLRDVLTDPPEALPPSGLGAHETAAGAHGLPVDPSTLVLDADLAAAELQLLGGLVGRAATITGGGVLTYTATNSVKWTLRFIVIGVDRPGVAKQGYFNITVPPDGTVIPGVNGAPAVTVADGQVPLGAWHVLYYILPLGETTTSLPENFRIAGYTADGAIPSHWVPIAAQNGDYGFVRFCTGHILDNGQSVNSWEVVPDAAVTTVKIADLAVSAPKIADLNVTTAKLADGAVNSPKLLDQAVNDPKIADGAIVDRHIRATAAIADSKLAIPDRAKKAYVRSRLQNLVTNGSGLLGDNTNFSGLTFRGDEVKVGGGSFYSDTFQTARYADEMIPVDLDEMYLLEGWFKCTADTGQRQYFGVREYDIDHLDVATAHTIHPAETETTLAADLVPGASSAALTSTTGWPDDPGAGRHFQAFGYANSFGYVYPDYTYTRHIVPVPTTDAIDEVAGAVRLAQPWPAAFGTIPAGRAVSLSNASGALKYPGGAGLITPTTWAKRTGHIGRETSRTADSSTKFRPGTAFVKVLFLVNYTAAGHVFWSGITFGRHPRAIKDAAGVWRDHVLDAAGAASYPALA